MSAPTPCSNCTNAPAALHHLHRVTPACNANQCQQGRTNCPVPQACQVAEDMPAAPSDNADTTGFWLFVLVAFMSLAFVVILAGSA